MAAAKSQPSPTPTTPRGARSDAARAALPTGPDATRVQVTSGGAPLHEDPLRFEQSLELVELSVDERELEVLTLTQLDGHVPLLFVEGSVTVA